MKGFFYRNRDLAKDGNSCRDKAFHVKARDWPKTGFSCCDKLFHVAIEFWSSPKGFYCYKEIPCRDRAGHDREFWGRSRAGRVKTRAHNRCPTRAIRGPS